ncbi:hypothetical protein LUZ61_002422 [Rhynchospora tenuis]|uniref:Uncharacterized protein n=1 Tax=Rhynchospora tenuis TaxID=198213 RepID=A0AAD5ZIV3_9POAL|nr:hypothetical protein LUZ61_002422 [Rhynchospora tenuis]
MGGSVRSGAETTKGGAKKKGSSTFVVDCVKPVEERIKVTGGKVGALGDAVTVTSDGLSPRGSHLYSLNLFLLLFKWRPWFSEEVKEKNEGGFYGYSWLDEKG